MFDVDSNYKEGQDLMTDFNVVKYEEPVKMINISVPKVYFKWNKIHKLGMWKRWINYQINKFRKKYSYKENPNFNIYYKFPNFKNVPDIFTEEDQVVITRKIHGTNARYGVVKRSNLNIFAKIKHWFTKNPFDLYEFVYGDFHKDYDGSLYHYITKLPDMENEFQTSFYNLESNTVTQCTGLKDRNGTPGYYCWTG